MVKVYFATNRNPNNPKNPTTFGRDFNTTGLNALRFGSAEVTGQKLDKVSIEVFPENLKSDQLVLGSDAMFEELRASMKSKKQDTVFFIHGFNYNFKAALSGAAKFKKRFASVPRTWMVFTWPSDGSMELIKAYKNDRLDAEASGAGMARGILKAAEFVRSLATNDNCNQRIHLIAHSMGNYVLRHAVQEMRRFVGGALPRLFDQIVLLAADEDTDTLELDYKLGPLERLGRRTTVYYNMQDVALFISDVTKGNPNRLGDIGPRNPAALPSNFSLINASAAGASDAQDDPTRHQYYLINDAVRDDILAVLEGKDDATIAKETKNRTWRPEGNYWRLDSAESKPGKSSKNPARGQKK